jgi:uncharacterized protein YdaU (DUF1376 family)
MKTDMWMPLYIADYLADTADLSCEEHGAYLLLLMHCWRKGELPNDDVRLQRICKLSPYKWKNLSPIIREFFYEKDGVLRHKRIDKERLQAAENRDKKSEIARNAANKRWQKDDADALHEACPSPSPTPVVPNGTTEYKPDPPSLFDDGKDDDDLLALPAICDRSTEGEAVRIWNETAKSLGLPQCQKLTDARRSRLRKRLSDCGGVEGWRVAMSKVADAAWMHGENSRGWKANIDFVLQESSFTKLMEGAYDRTDGAGGGSIMDEFDKIRDEYFGGAA